MLPCDAVTRETIRVNVAHRRRTHRMRKALDSRLFLPQPPIVLMPEFADYENDSSLLRWNPMRFLEVAFRSLPQLPERERAHVIEFAHFAIATLWMMSEGLFAPI